MMLLWRCIIVAVVIAVSLMRPDSAAAQNEARKNLLEGIDVNTPGPELFLRAYEVFSHPRCSNCHPRDDRPRWGARVHGMNVQRGQEQPKGDKHKKEGGYGSPGMPCSTCHQGQNGELQGSPPGAQDWRLAPVRMGWVGLTAADLCLQLKRLEQEDDETIEHIVNPDKLDALVAWAWHPGPGRERPPGDLNQLVQILTWWKTAGAGCPPSGK